MATTGSRHKTAGGYTKHPVMMAASLPRPRSKLDQVRASVYPVEN